MSKESLWYGQDVTDEEKEATDRGEWMKWINVYRYVCKCLVTARKQELRTLTSVSINTRYNMPLYHMYMCDTLIIALSLTRIHILLGID